MQSIPVFIPKWALWQDHAAQPTLMTQQSGNTPIGIDTKDLARDIAPVWRRRLDLFGRASAEVLSQILVGLPENQLRNTRVIFASRHGNIERTLKLLGQIARAEIPSPADFSMSVHNALVGVASINWAITQSHSAISAGNDSFIAALTEALAQLTDDRQSPVAIVYVDLPLPDIYARNDPADMTGTAFAMLMQTDESVVANTGFTFEPRPVSSADATETTETFARTHACMMARFLKVEKENAPSTCLLAGRSFAWNVLRNE
tara:strand:- start:43026 stop:43808 length:783 start_codon:yes stop_codon:yes gene_type:complete